MQPALEVVALRGPSQVGKSTFMGELMLPGQGDPPVVGDGTGESVTQDTSLRTTSVGLLLDGPGDNDSFLRFTNEEAGRRYAVGVASARAERVKFLVFESMAGDKMELRGTLASLVTTFGANALEGVVVVASKKDLRPGATGKARLLAVRQVMQEKGLTELVTWQSHGLDEEEKASQLEDLRSALARVQGVSTSDLEDLWQRQRRRAQELYDAQPMRTKVIGVEEQYTYPYQEDEEYEEKEAYLAIETRTTTVQRSRVVWNPPQGPFLHSITFFQNSAGASEGDIREGSRGAFIFPHFGWTSNENEAVRGFSFVFGESLAPPGYEKIHFDLNKRARGTFNFLCVTRQGNSLPISAATFLKFGGAFVGTEYNGWMVFPQDLLVNGGGRFVYVGFKQAAGHNATVTETVPQSVDVEVAKVRTVTKKRTVTKFGTAQRVVNESVEYALPLEDFYQLALDQIITEIRNTFTSTLQTRPAGLEDDVSAEDSVSLVGVVGSHAAASISGAPPQCSLFGAVPTSSLSAPSTQSSKLPTPLSNFVVKVEFNGEKWRVPVSDIQRDDFHGMRSLLESSGVPASVALGFRAEDGQVCPWSHATHEAAISTALASIAADGGSVLRLAMLPPDAATLAASEHSCEFCGAPPTPPKGDLAYHHLGYIRGEAESDTSSWISVHAVGNCFMPDTIFKTWANPANPGVFFLSAQALTKGSRVENADGTRTLEVISIGVRGGACDRIACGRRCGTPQGCLRPPCVGPFRRCAQS